MPAKELPRPSGFRRAPLAACLAIAGVAAGCYHLILPVNPERLPDEVAPLRIEPRRTVRLINGYSEPREVWFRREGIHHLGADLREWTDRLLSQLQIELEPRGVSSLIERGDSRAVENDAALRIRITRIIPPGVSAPAPSDGDSGDRGPLLEAAIESEDGEYSAEFASSAASHGFADAFYTLKEAILVDGNLAEWFRRGPNRAAVPD